MTSLTFHLIIPSDNATFLNSLRKLPKDSRPLWVGETKHWIHEPELSKQGLTGSTPAPTVWQYLVVLPSSGPSGLDLPTEVVSAVTHKWSIAAPVDSAWIAALQTEHSARKAKPAPPLPAGWSATDTSGISAAIPPPDLGASLGLRSRPLGKTEPVVLKDFIASFASAYGGPVAMFNLLSYMPDGGREQYFGYIRAFQASTGIKYGGEALFLGTDVSEWSSRMEEGEGEGEGWKDCALVWYPSLWHFGKMLDDPEYAKADREFKHGAIRDNPLICCVEVDVGYAD